MQATSRARRAIGGLVAAAVGTIALAAMVAVVAVPAWANGPTPAQLSAAGWDCFQTPPIAVPPRIVCANPGVGRPFPGNPDPPPAYNLLTWALDGAFLGTVHLIRADLYAGQPCPQSGYVFRAAIGYYECLRV